MLRSENREARVIGSRLAGAGRDGKFARSACGAVIAASLFALSGCSSGRASMNASSHPHSTLPVAALHCPLPDITPAAVDLERRNPIFVHPGMVWVSDRWDSGPIVVTGNALRDEGYASDVVIVAGRDPQRMFEQMMNSPGTQFVGLHYSMGGNAELLAKTYEATRRASIERGVQLRYHAVLIDPFGIADLGTRVDLARPEVGQVLFILSSDNSLLRGRVNGLFDSLGQSPKVNFVYAEDVGEKWGHFSILPSGRTPGQSGLTAQSGDGPLATHKTMMLLRAFMTIAQTQAAGEMPQVDAACLMSPITRLAALARAFGKPIP